MTVMTRKPYLPALLLALAFFPSCSKDAANPPAASATYYYPPLAGSAWETANAASLGWDAGKLNEAVDYIGSNNSDALIILYKGRIVTEKYWNGFTPSSSKRIFSATKSMAGFMVGLAQEQGRLDIGRKVSDYIGTGWSGATLAQESQITVRHLVSMTSGLKEDLAYEAAPGTKWFYNTPAYHRIFAVLANAYKQNNTDYTKVQLWDRIGMRDSFWDTEPVVGGGGPSMSCSARDMARFGLLIVSDGKWNGTAIMNDAAYFQSMTGSSQPHNPSYGYLWWLNGKPSYVLPAGRQPVAGALMPNAPPDLVAALGYNDKKIYVVKSMDLVVVRHGGQSGVPSSLALSSFDNEIWKRLVLAIK